MHGISEQTIINYQSGYNSGINYADSRVNESSINYSTGYNNGYNEGSSKVTIDGESVKDKMELVSENVNNLIIDCGIALQYATATVLDDGIHIIEAARSHYIWNGRLSFVDKAPSDSDVYSVAVTLNNEIHLLTQHKHYKWDGSAWTEISALPYRFGGSAVVLNNEIHILGSDLESQDNQKHYKWNGTRWQSVSTLPDTFGGRNQATVLDGNIYIAGTGPNNNGFYKWDGSAWTFITNLPYDSPYGFSYGALVTLGDEIHIIGGSSSNGGQYNHYKWKNNSLTALDKLFCAIHKDGADDSKYIASGHVERSAVVYNDVIYSFGGNSWVNKLVWSLNAPIYLKK